MTAWAQGRPWWPTAPLPLPWLGWVSAPEREWLLRARVREWLERRRLVTAPLLAWVRAAGAGSFSAAVAGGRTTSRATAGSDQS